MGHPNKIKKKTKNNEQTSTQMHQGNILFKETRNPFIRDESFYSVNNHSL